MSPAETNLIMGTAYDTRRLCLSSCLRCHRVLTPQDRRFDNPEREPDQCGWCDTPLSKKATRRLGPAHHGQRALEEVCG